MVLASLILGISTAAFWTFSDLLWKRLVNTVIGSFPDFGLSLDYLVCRENFLVL